MTQKRVSEKKSLAKSNFIKSSNLSQGGLRFVGGSVKELLSNLYGGVCERVGGGGGGGGEGGISGLAKQSGRKSQKIDCLLQRKCIIKL